MARIEKGCESTDETETESEAGASRSAVPASLAPFRPPRSIFPTSEDESDGIAIFQSLSKDKMNNSTLPLTSWYSQARSQHSSSEEKSENEPRPPSKNLEAYVWLSRYFCALKIRRIIYEFHEIESYWCNSKLRFNFFSTLLFDQRNLVAAILYDCVQHVYFKIIAAFDNWSRFYGLVL